MSIPLLPDSPLSLWLDLFGDYHPQPDLQEHVSVDVAIIGGGFTGVATAFELKKADPNLNVALLEAKTVGYGASGRNGSFAMTVVGLGFGVTAMLRGKDYVRRAHGYMMKAVDGLEELIHAENLDCDMIRPGFLRTATTQSYIKRIQHDVKLMNELGFDDITWISPEEVRQRVDSTVYLGAMWEPRLLLINPAKLVRAERDLALRRGVRIYENSPVVTITSQPQFTITTPRGSVTAEKVVFATNGYSHLFPQLKRKQVPAFTYMIATEPLSDRQLEPIGWQGKEGIEDARNLIHYYRLTPDQRIVLGGGPVGLTWANSLYGDSDRDAWRHLEEHLVWLFPSLKGVQVTHRWGGPFSVTMNLSPALGYIGDERAIYSVGCIGHGVSMSHRNAQAIRDLLLERQSELLECPFVNPRVIPWPPEPLRMMTAGALRAYLQLEDWWYEREINPLTEP
ncbi:MAG: FAD-dependent oxidoreductase [FCB group bacterium]|nr:FAD-dependent oxidoreductase [FCB group bacterium]